MDDGPLEEPEWPNTERLRPGRIMLFQRRTDKLLDKFMVLL